MNIMSRLTNLLKAYFQEARLPAKKTESSKFSVALPVARELSMAISPKLDKDGQPVLNKKTGQPVLVQTGAIESTVLQNPEEYECDNAIVAFMHARGRIADVGATKFFHVRKMGPFLMGKVLAFARGKVAVFAMESEERAVRQGKKVTEGYLTHILWVKGDSPLAKVCMKQTKRLKANAILLANGEPSIAKDIRVLLFAYDKAIESTLDGGLWACRGRVAKDIIEEIVAISMTGSVPMTIRQTSEAAEWRGGKGSENLVSEERFAELFLQYVGRQWNPDTDPAVIAPALTVKNGVAGEIVTLDVLFHKVNVKNGWQNTNLDRKSELLTPWVKSSKRLLKIMHDKKAKKVGLNLSSIETFVAALIKADDSDVDAMARDEHGETDQAVRRQVNNIRTLLAAGHSWKQFPALCKVAYEKMAQKATTVSVRALPLAVELHDGAIVDGVNVWISLPKETKREICNDDVQIGDWSDIKTKIHLRSIDLYGEVKRKGFVTVWRSPVTHGMITVPFNKIAWTENGQTLLVNKYFSYWFTSDQDGDPYFVTTSLKAIAVDNLEVLVSEQKAMDEKVFAELRAPLFEMIERRKNVIKAAGGGEDNLDAFPLANDIYAPARKAIAAYRLTKDEGAMVLGFIAAESIGVMSNLAITWFENHGEECDMMRFRAYVHVLGEEIIQAMKHTEGAFFPTALQAAITMGIALEIEALNGVIYKQPRGWFSRVVREPLAVTAMSSGIVEFEGSQYTTGEDGEAKPWTQDTHWVCQPANEMLRSLDLSVYDNFSDTISTTVLGGEGEDDVVTYKNVAKPVYPEAITRIEKAVKALVVCMDRRWMAEFKEPFFNAQDSKFPATSKVLAMEPGLATYNLPLQWSRTLVGKYPQKAAVAVLSANGDQSDNMELIRKWDAANPSRYPLAPAIVLIRFWNASRPNSKVAMFNSGRNMQSELAVVGEWIRLANKEPEPITITKEGQAWWNAFKKAAASIPLLTWNGSQGKEPVVEEASAPVVETVVVEEKAAAPAIKQKSTADSPNRLFDKADVETLIGLSEFPTQEVTLYTKKEGHPISKGYTRVVYGDHGPYIEMTKEQVKSIIVAANWILKAKGDKAWYDEYTSKDGVMLYIQKKDVSMLPNPPAGVRSSRNNRKEGYADYKVGMVYVDPFKVKLTA